LILNHDVHTEKWLGQKVLVLPMLEATKMLQDKDP